MTIREKKVLARDIEIQKPFTFLGEKTPYSVMYFKTFKNYCCSIYLWQLGGYPYFLIRFETALAKICFSHIVINYAKIHVFLVFT